MTTVKKDYPTISEDQRDFSQNNDVEYDNQVGILGDIPSNKEKNKDNFLHRLGSTETPKMQRMYVKAVDVENNERILEVSSPVHPN